MALSRPTAIHLPARPALGSDFRKASYGLDSSIDYPFKGADHRTLAERTVSQNQPNNRNCRHEIHIASSKRRVLTMIARIDKKYQETVSAPSAAMRSPSLRSRKPVLNCTEQAAPYRGMPFQLLWARWAGPALWAHRHGPRGGVPNALNRLLIAVGAGRLLARCADVGALSIPSLRPASQADLGR
jgi:hypothetical protein